MSQRADFFAGWGGRIRTYAMLESESNALPLGDTPPQTPKSCAFLLVCSFSPKMASIFGDPVGAALLLIFAASVKKYRLNACLLLVGEAPKIL